MTTVNAAHKTARRKQRKSDDEYTEPILQLEKKLIHHLPQQDQLSLYSR
jgi:hypothetical protein